MITIDASKLSFVERLPELTKKGEHRRRTHHFAWGQCRVCGELQLVPRAGLRDHRCILTPGCPGKLTRAGDVQVIKERGDVDG